MGPVKEQALSQGPQEAGITQLHPGMNSVRLASLSFLRDMEGATPLAFLPQFFPGTKDSLPLFQGLEQPRQPHHRSVLLHGMKNVSMILNPGSLSVQIHKKGQTWAGQELSGRSLACHAQDPGSISSMGAGGWGRRRRDTII